MHSNSPRISTSPRKNSRTATAVAAFLCLGLSASHGQSLLINFGVEISNDTNSPMHADGGLTGTNWNLITNQAETIGIVDPLGDATGVTVELGRVHTTEANDPLEWGSNLPSTNSWTTFGTSGIYAGNARSTVYIPQDYLDLAVRLNGLQPGIYDIYFNSRFTNNTSAQDYAYHATTVASSTEGFNTEEYADFTSELVSYPGKTDWAAGTPNVWTLNEDYGVMRITVGTDEDIVFVVEGMGDGGGAERAFLNTMGVIAIPEPSTVGLIAAGLTGMVTVFVRRRTKRRAAL